ncbi:glycosyltransferase family 2 protein [Sulfitobacter sp. JB4-11]|uniref:glycosyltransferase family 2 protein n=1 Tax=Sulfitobacter rhodophyticola TaxID=3238304 RepID=UPI003513A45D
MKVCAITMVYRDYWALSQWYAHYSRHLGAANLYIVSHGSDAKVSELCPAANIITVPRDTLAGFDRKRADLLNSLQDSLGVVFDWVIRTDADELICLDPEHHTSFTAFFETVNGSAVFALGINVVEGPDERPVDDSVGCLSVRRNAVFSGHYSKAWAVKRGTHLVRHGIVSDDKDDFRIPVGVYLMHLKYASMKALAAVNADRMDVASGEEPGLPGKAWLDAEADAKKFVKRFNSLEPVEWCKASLDAYNAVSSHSVVDGGIVRASSIRLDLRTTLPDWFKYC